MAAEDPRESGEARLGFGSGAAGEGSGGELAASSRSFPLAGQSFQDFLAGREDHLSKAVDVLRNAWSCRRKNKS